MRIKTTGYTAYVLLSSWSGGYWGRTNGNKAIGFSGAI